MSERARQTERERERERESKTDERERGEGRVSYYLLLEEFDDRDSSVGIQPSGRLIQEENLRLNDELHSNIGSLSLSPGHPSEELCPDLPTGVAILSSTVTITTATPHSSSYGCSSQQLMQHLESHIVSTLTPTSDMQPWPNVVPGATSGPQSYFCGCWPVTWQSGSSKSTMF